MHPATMQLMAEVRAQEMLLKPRLSRPTRHNDKGLGARLRRFIPDLMSATA